MAHLPPGYALETSQKWQRSSFSFSGVTNAGVTRCGTDGVTLYFFLQKVMTFFVIVLKIDALWRHLDGDRGLFSSFSLYFEGDD